MVPALETRIFSHVDFERSKPTHFVPATDLSLDGQAWFARRTHGSFQQDNYSEENIVFFALDEVGFIFPKAGGFRILQKGKKDGVGFSQDRKENSDVENGYPAAIIAFDPNGTVHIVWPEQTDEIMYGFAGVTIQPGINTKNVQFHEIQNMQNVEPSILLDAASIAYERMIGSVA